MKLYSPIIALSLLGASFSYSATAHGQTVRQRLRQIEATLAIKDTAACYGQGHDAIFQDLGGNQQQAFAILRECFADDVQSDIVFFGTTTDRLTSLTELVQFIETFAINENYTSARNVVGDVRVEFTGPRTAVMTSATQTPHFIAGNGTEGPTVDVVTARYVDYLERRHGKWRIVHKTLLIDEIWRGVGSYPFAP